MKLEEIVEALKKLSEEELRAIFLLVCSMI